MHDLIDIATDELLNIVKWLNANNMSLNIEKTNHIIFCNRGKTIDGAGDILINYCNISIVCNTIFLGMIIESNLAWNYHRLYM